MRKATIAEWILSLTVVPERAATTVGDLLEAGSDRGPLWFWSSILRTAFLQSMKDLLISPALMLWLAFGGWVTAVIASFMLSNLVINGMLVGIPTGWRLVVIPQLPPWKITALQGLEIVIPFFVGRMVARLSGGREVAAAFAVNFLTSTIWILSFYPVLRFGSLASLPFILESAFVALCVRPFFVMAGAISFRSRMRHA